jgi:putative PIN family toxin of toxin-antitoxin system
VLRVVIDPNVFVSAVISPDGVPGEVVRAALARKFHLVVSATLIGELSDVLSRPKLRPYIDAEQARTLVDSILGVAELLDAPKSTGSRVRDADDEYLCALADATAADVLVSGDRDLADAALVTAVVMTPRAFLDELSS